MHFKVVCKICGGIIEQCRCPSEHKEVTYETCKTCTIKLQQTPQAKEPQNNPQ